MEEEGSSIQSQNPMEIDIIIDTIVSHLHRLEDLTSCRQIDHKWNSLVSPKLQKKLSSKSLVFEAQRQIRNDTDLPVTGDPTGSKLQDFLEFLQTPGFFTFSNFTFIDICLQHPMTQQFLTLYGHLMGTLTLDYRKLIWHKMAVENESGTKIQNRTEAFMNLIQRQCPNLQKLTIYVEYGPSPFLLDQWQPKDIVTKCKIKELTLRYDFSQNHATQHQNFLQGLMSCCTSSLQRFTIGSRYAPTSTSGAVGAEQNIFDIFLTPFITSCAATLKELNIVEYENLGANTTSTLLRLFSHPQLQLKCLRIHGNIYCGFSNGNGNPLSTTMELQKSSLEEIRLIPSGYGTRIAFPDCMPELKFLTVPLNPYWSPSTPIFAATNFLLQLPSLKQLVFTTKSKVDSSWEGLKFLTENSDPQLKLTELRLPFANSEVLEHAPKVFPNVKELVIETDLGGLGGIFSWSELESLHVTLRARPKKDGQHSTLEQILDRNSPSGKSLILLKKLKQLTINWIRPSYRGGDYDFYDSDGKFHISEPLVMRILTDASLLNVFSKLPELEYISILEHKISDEAAFKLLDTGRMQLLSDGDGIRFKCQKDYFEEDYIPHKLLQGENNSL